MFALIKKNIIIFLFSKKKPIYNCESSIKYSRPSRLNRGLLLQNHITICIHQTKMRYCQLSDILFCPLPIRMASDALANSEDPDKIQQGAEF